MAILKEYHEIVGEARPRSGFFPTHADFLQKCISDHEQARIQGVAEGADARRKMCTFCK